MIWILALLHLSSATGAPWLTEDTWPIAQGNRQHTGTTPKPWTARTIKDSYSSLEEWIQSATKLAANSKATCWTINYNGYVVAGAGNILLSLHTNETDNRQGVVYQDGPIPSTTGWHSGPGTFLTQIPDYGHGVDAVRDVSINGSPAEATANYDCNLEAYNTGPCSYSEWGFDNSNSMPVATPIAPFLNKIVYSVRDDLEGVLFHQDYPTEAWYATEFENQRAFVAPNGEPLSGVAVTVGVTRSEGPETLLVAGAKGHLYDERLGVYYAYYDGIYNETSASTCFSDYNTLAAFDQTIGTIPVPSWHPDGFAVHVYCKSIHAVNVLDASPFLVQRWAVELSPDDGVIRGSVAIDSTTGNIHVLTDAKIISFDSNGVFRWSVPWNGGPMSPLITRDGSIVLQGSVRPDLFVILSSDDGSTLLNITAAPSYTDGGSTAQYDQCHPFPALAADGTIYFPSAWSIDPPAAPIEHSMSVLRLAPKCATGFESSGAPPDGSATGAPGDITCTCTNGAVDLELSACVACTGGKVVSTSSYDPLTGEFAALFTFCAPPECPGQPNVEYTGGQCLCDCSGDTWCFSLGQDLGFDCLPRMAPGNNCTSQDQCTIACVGDVCCDDACNQPCEQCSALGVCGPMPAGDPEDEECPDTRAGACSNDVMTPYVCAGTSATCEDGSSYACTGQLQCNTAGTQCLSECDVSLTNGGCIENYFCNDSLVPPTCLDCDQLFGTGQSGLMCSACSLEEGCTSCLGVLTAEDQSVCLASCPTGQYLKSEGECGSCDNDFGNGVGGALCTACSASGCFPAGCLLGFLSSGTTAKICLYQCPSGEEDDGTGQCEEKTTDDAATSLLDSLGPNGTIIVGGIGGAIVLVVIALVLFAVIQRRRIAEAEVESVMPSDYAGDTTSGEGSTASLTSTIDISGATEMGTVGTMGVSGAGDTLMGDTLGDIPDTVA